jgi:phenylalanyl-tRNA synthetase alpha chain
MIMLDVALINKKYKELIEAAENLDFLEKVRLQALGKKGEISLLMRSLGQMDLQDRLRISPLLNDLKKKIEVALQDKKKKLQEAAIKSNMSNEWLDLSQDSRELRVGSIHPVTRVTEEVISIFSDIGFSVAEGPQIESDWYNFDSLNIPPDHPARQEFDTFYVDGNLDQEQGKRPNVLRTHTSPVQIRHMEKYGVPCKIIAPGRVFRSDYDLTHTPMFHQVEGLAIGEKISMANLKWVLVEFCKSFFELDDLDLRFRASHFPFTEPSAEVDIRCSWVNNKLVIGKGEDWLEILGSGMVHPKVLDAAGVDSDKYQGFAFGMGIDRLAMLKYGVPDLRSFFENDLKWLKHYSFSPENSPNLYDNLSG